MFGINHWELLILTGLAIFVGPPLFVVYIVWRIRKAKHDDEIRGS